MWRPSFSRVCGFVLAFCVLCLVGCGEPEPLPRDLVQLPKVAAVWRGPLPAGPHVEVVITADEALHAGGHATPMTLNKDGATTLREAFIRATSGDASRNDDGTSAVPILVRVDGRVPWRAVQFVMQLSVHPKVQMYRILLVAKCERDGVEGVLPWILPRSGSGHMQSIPALRLRLTRHADGMATAHTVVRLHPDAEFRLTAQGPERVAALDAVRAAMRVQLGAIGERREDAAAEITLSPPPATSTVPYRDVAALLGLLLAENVYPELPAATVETDLGYRADGSRVTAAEAAAPQPYGGPVGIVPTWLMPPPPPSPSAPVARALAWLAAHQSPDGRFGAATFARWCNGKERFASPAADRGDAGKAANDVGVTGLALSAFLSAGYTNRGDHAFKRMISLGLRFLKRMQGKDGRFGTNTGPGANYNHAAGALALIDAYGQTRSPIYKGAVKRGLGFAEAARNPASVWRYGLRPGDNDTSVTGWMALAHLRAHEINAARLGTDRPPAFELDAAVRSAVATWLDQVTDPETGRVGYITRSSGLSRTPAQMARWPREHSEALTALGLQLRLRLGTPPEDPRVQQMAALIRSLSPDDPSAASVDFVFWRFAAEALHQVGDEASLAWVAALQAAVVKRQHTDGEACDLLGSWDPSGPFGAAGGRVYATAMAVLCLTAGTRPALP